jgi:hypothetical protein
MAKSVEIRSELEDLIRRDLLGPWEGENEIIDKSPKSRYVVGRLAPIIKNPSLESGVGTGDEEVVGNPVQENPGIIANNADADEDAVKTTTSTWPSSIGLRCQVPLDQKALSVTAKWGSYKSKSAENDQGNTRAVWEREQKTAVFDVELVSGKSEYADDVIKIHVEVFQELEKQIVEISLINNQEVEGKSPAAKWLYQVGFSVVSPKGEAVFLPVLNPMVNDYLPEDVEEQHLALLYRDRLEYAIGRTCSVAVVEIPDVKRAIEVRTEWLPTTDVSQTKAAGAEGVTLSMKALATASTRELESGLDPLIVGYTNWIESQSQKASDLPKHLNQVAQLPLLHAGWVNSRLKEGLILLTEDSQQGVQARKAFSFMNQAMYDQRIRSQVAALRTSDTDLSISQALSKVADSGESAASWRPFQLAFILLQLPQLVRPEETLRSGDGGGFAELLFFPTGGGKTEAYLGLAAFTFAIRRLQGQIESNDGWLDGSSGVGVIMRYTLRLLTSQQFVRATTLMCAAETIRQSDPETWGDEPFRIGLWVGSSVSPKHYEEAKVQVNEAHADSSVHNLTVLQIKRCPWCGTKINPLQDVKTNDTLRRVFVHCGDSNGQCEFSAAKSVEGLPLLTVDEEIYRMPPAFLLATVDKFARLSREGQAASLFGYVKEKCSRHGYRHDDTVKKICSGAASHNAVGQLPAASTEPVSRLRPPDLIIQDELHLISGALGTAVGLFESAVDIVCSWRTKDGDYVKPLIVASTATIRNAKEQVRRLYGRDVSVFPPQVLDVTDTYFSKEVEVTEATPGRRYMGVCAPGEKHVVMQNQIFANLLLSGQRLLDMHGELADPYMTVVGYFNATRELAGMRRHIDDSVTTMVSDNRAIKGMKRRITSNLRVGELTSRISSGEISSTLDALGFKFDPAVASSAAREAWAVANREAKKNKQPPPPFLGGNIPYDVILATSMLQVGVDVPRLGLMLVVGQPKNTAEYIQASSRVGRDPDKHGPGLVLTLANWARPRDMAHFEQFDYYHRTFYAHVESLSVTPYSEAAIERGLTGVLISAARIFDASVSSTSLASNKGAKNAQTRKNDVLERIVAEVVKRTELATDSKGTARLVQAKLITRIDTWIKKANQGIAYSKEKSDTENLIPLLLSPEESALSHEDALFKVANSMREVQPEVNLVTMPNSLGNYVSDNKRSWRFADPKVENND